MLSSTSSAVRLLLYGVAASCLFAQSKPGPDILIFIDGEKLIGQLKSASDSKVVFVSDMAGEVTVPWSKIQELRSETKFAAIPKDVIIRNGADAAKVAQGTLEMTNQKLEVTAAPGAPQTIPIGNVSNVVTETSFERALHHQGFFEGWKGGGGIGLAITQSTTNSRTFSSNINLFRTDPSENWLQARNRTSLDFNSFYGKTSSFGDVTKVSLFQSNALRDFYLTPRRFLFAGANWEHNSAQGLDLSQGYGGGVGLVLFKSERSELSGRAGLGYVHQGFSDPRLDKHIIGSRFNETYSRTFARGISFSETAGFRPAWNHPKAYVTGFVASLNIPMYHQLSASLNSFDSYINDPPPFFKRNSFQLSVGVNYALK